MIKIVFENIANSNIKIYNISRFKQGKEKLLNLSTKEIKDLREYINIVKPIIDNPEVQKMKNFRQHYDTSCFEHCLHVSLISYYIGKHLGLDYVSMARAGMLHDFFLYDWRDPDRHQVKGFFNKHAFTHGLIAYRKAKIYFTINRCERDIIINHMWPVTVRLPRYKETYIVTLVDKYCALYEARLNFVMRIQDSFIAKKLNMGKEEEKS